MSFWKPQYSPTQNNHNDPNNPNIEPNLDNQLSQLPPNITALDTGKFRAYKNRNSTRYYLGTFNTIDEAIQAQESFALTGQIPERQRQSRKTDLSSLVNYFLEINGDL